VVLSGQNSRRLFLETPIMNASGCLKPGAIEQEQVDISDFGALITKGTTLLPQIGNPSPRICEGPSVLLNSIGLENLGVEEFAKQILPRWQKFGLPVIVNIAGKKVEDYVEIARRLKDEKIVGFEINVSCPNVGGKIIGKSSEETYSVVRAVRKVVPGGFGMFLIVKLSPAADDIVAVAKAAVGAGADAISAINTFPGMDIDIYTGQPKLGNVFGGVSGPGIVHMALKIVYDLCQAKLGVPIIGLGGIKNAESAIKFFMVGASAIQIGTELFRSPQGIPKIYQEMCQIAEKIGE
jgi:dihydroorotate dehydrogenase (NAD+) catalytic subunit